MVAEVKTCRKGLHVYDALLGRCPECIKISKRKWNENNKEARRQASRTWQRNNRKKQRENCKKWYEKNKEKHIENHKKWALKNAAKERAYHNKWVEKNRELINSAAAKRRALRQQAIPVWADLEKIKEIYKKAFNLTKQTGIKHHVDHIYPLNSKYMCGLHVENNLQILTAAENIAKGNRMWPGQLDCQKD